MASQLLVLPLKKGIHPQLIHAVLPYDRFMTVTEIAERTKLGVKQVASAAAHLVPVCLAERKKNEVREPPYENRMFMYKGFPESSPRFEPQSMDEGKTLATKKTPPPDQVIPPEFTEQSDLFDVPKVRFFNVIKREGDRFNGAMDYMSSDELAKVMRIANTIWQAKIAEGEEDKLVDIAASLVGLNAQGDGSKSYQDENGHIVSEWMFTINRNLPSNGKGDNICLKFVRRSSATPKHPYTGTTPGNPGHTSATQH